MATKIKGHKKRHKTNPGTKVVYRYRDKPKKKRNARKRRNPGRNIGAELMSAKVMLPDMIGVLGGLVAAKFAVQKIFPTQTGYAKAGLQAAAALAVGMAGRSLLKGQKSQRIAKFLMIGGLAAAAVTAFDTVTSGTYRSYYQLADAGPVYRIPTGYMPRALSAGRSYGTISPIRKTAYGSAI